MIPVPRFCGNNSEIVGFNLALYLGFSLIKVSKVVNFSGDPALVEEEAVVVRARISVRQLGDFQ